MPRDRRRQAGLAGVLGGAGLLVYVLLKELWIPTVGGMAHFDATMGFSFHLFEVPPMVLLSVGLFGLYAAERDPEPDLADAALGLAAVGMGSATVGHTVEHILFHFGSNLGYAGAAAHYVGMGLAGLGLTVAGLRADPSPVLGPRERTLLASTLPVAVLLAAVLGTLVFRSYADGAKIQVALVVAAVGYRLWRPRSGADAPSGTAVSDAST